MKDEKLVSVCINAYNSENTIKKTIESVLTQTYRNLQIIIVDDGSTDRTSEVVRQINDERIELHVLPKNRNVSNANNECLRHAQGAYIAHLDSDDIWLPEKIEKQVNFMENHLEYGACFTLAGFVTLDGAEVTEDSCPSDFAFPLDLFIMDNYSQAEMLRFFYDSHNHLCHSTMLMRASVYQTIGNHDLTMKLLHDYDYWVRMVQRFPIYILQEKLNFNTVHDSNHSALSSRASVIAHDEEFARIRYKMINDCPKELFLEAFQGLLHIQGPHTDEEVELEKAFLLLKSMDPVRPGNKILGLKKLDELLSSDTMLRLAENRFDFQISDLYKLHQNELFYNETTIQNLENTVLNHQNTIQSLGDKVSDLEQQLQDSAVAYQELHKVCTDTQQALNDFINSRWYRTMLPLIRTKIRLTGLYRLFRPLLKNGQKPKRSFLLYGFYGSNLGDDMFFDVLFKRYPDTLFNVVFYPHYEAFFSKYENVRFFDISQEMPAKINAFGMKFGKTNFFETVLQYASDGVIHIGGSVYQQICEWEKDLEIRKKRKRVGKKFFAISNIFGPYNTEDYKTFWEKQFKKWTDVCFRDTYSYNLFSHIPTARYAPDLLFQTQPEKCEEQKKVAISVITTDLSIRSFSTETCQTYTDTLVSLIQEFVARDYKISLLGFCELEQDSKQIELLLSRLSEQEQEKVTTALYHNDIRQILEEIETSEYVIATRFHAMVLGYMFGKKVLPLCYSSKTTNVIEDLSLTDHIITLEDLGKYTAEELISFANAVDEEKIKSLRSQAQKQFEALDSYIASKNGVVNP